MTNSKHTTKKRDLGVQRNIGNLNSQSIKNTTEYQIYIGCNDVFAQKEIVSEEELRNMVRAFFERREIAFSMISLKGGFLYANGGYVLEDTLCINIVTDNEEGIKALAKDLSMYMNQESILILKNSLSAEYR